MNLLCQELKGHLRERLKHQCELPVRIRVLFDDIQTRLQQHTQIDVFELLIALIGSADEAPAQYLMALLAVTDEEALTLLDRNTVANIAAFTRDTMKIKALLKQ